MAQQIQIRRDTSTNWSSVNPTLAQGELGLETNTGKVKIGNGTTAWNSLSYFGGAGALASLTDVNLTSLASGQVILSNGSSIFINKSLSSLIGELAFASLGSLAFMNQLSFTSLTNQPSLSSLAFQSTLDYTSGQLTNKPSLGSLAPMNQLSFTSLLNQPSLGSLAVLNSLTKSDVGLGNVTNDAQLKIASNLSDLNNIATARGNLSLGSLAVLNSITAVLPSTASVDILFANGIVNSSTISTNLLYANGIFASNISVGILNALGANFTSTVSTNRLNTNQIFASNISVGNLTGLNGAFTSTVSTNFLYANGIFASNVSTGILTALGGAFLSTVSTFNIQGRSAVFVSTISVRDIRGTTAVWSGNISSNNIQGTNTGDQTMPFWGDGSDGSIVLDGSLDSQTYLFLTYDPTTSTYTLTRDVYAFDFTVNVNYTLITAGYRVFAKNSITNGGTIHNNGYSASGASGGRGGLGGFFRAGGNGTNGLPATNSGASGIFPILPTANTYLGTNAGRGASARTGVTANFATNNSFTSIAAPLYGGKQLVGNYFTYIEPTIQSNLTTSAPPTYSLGGGAGAKSAVGTTALSGGGGGGGGVVFLASPFITSSGIISSIGGDGGSATGTGGIFGGGGGGAGGIVVIHNSTANPAGSFSAPNVLGGLGGTSAGTANTLAVGRSDGSVYLSNATVQYIRFRPNTPINYGSYYLLSLHVTFNAGSSIGFNAGTVVGLGCSWLQLADVRFNSIATPTRALFVFEGRPNATDKDQLIDYIYMPSVGAFNSARVILDEIQNTAQWQFNTVNAGSTTNSSDSATTAVTNLGYTPTTNNMQYTVIATSGGTAFTAGTGNTMLNTAATAAPILQSSVAVSRASNSITWTTASAYGAFTIDLNQPTAQETGTPGNDGKFLQFYA